MSDQTLHHRLPEWQTKLQLSHYIISCERITPHQVCDDNCKRGLSFVGICTDHKTNTATLFHTRKLFMDDLIHELLHVKYPNWTEEQINIETEQILLQERESEVR